MCTYTTIKVTIGILVSVETIIVYNYYIENMETLANEKQSTFVPTPTTPLIYIPSP
jgi:hypothetical protein